MKLKIKKLCPHCAGVIGGKTFNVETGEYPCDCPPKIRNKKSVKFWKNGREKYND